MITKEDIEELKFTKGYWDDINPVDDINGRFYYKDINKFHTLDFDEENSVCIFTRTDGEGNIKDKYTINDLGIVKNISDRVDVFNTGIETDYEKYKSIK